MTLLDVLAPLAAVSVRPAVPAELDGWDTLVRRFPNCRVTHTRAWIESLAASGCGHPLYLVIEKDGEVAGCLPGLTGTVGGVKIFGSPREGWQTISLGPVFDPARIAGEDLMEAAARWLENVHGVRHIEVISTALDAGAMARAGFEGAVVPTFRAPLFPGDEAQGFRQLKDSARRNVRRAERLGLTVRFETDERFVDEHYAQLREVYLRGGFSIPFAKRRVLECFRAMRDSGRLLAAAVYLPDGATCVATGMFFVEGRELTLWMWATRPHYRWYRPTELMTWSVMRRAMALGCDTMDFMGRGDFKKVFGAELDERKHRFLRSRAKWLGVARRVAGTGYRLQQQLRGRVAIAARRLRERRGQVAPAVVMGDHDLVRALGLAGIPSVVVAPPGSAARYSRSAVGALPWVDSWDQPETMIDTLVAHGLRQSEPPVLFFQDDRSLLLVSRHRERLRQAFRFAIADAALVEALVDKSRFQQLAAQYRLPVPPARSADPAGEPVPEALQYPLIVKPITRRNAVWNPAVGDGKAMRAESAADLAALWPKLAEARVSVMLQACIEGPESRIESYHVYLDDKGQVRAEFTGRKIRTWPVRYGDTSALEITSAADVAELGRAVCARLKLTGTAKLDFKRAADGTLYLLEINPRCTLWMHPGARAGVNIPALIYGELMGRPRTTLSPARAGTRWVKPWTDVAAARAEGTSLALWVPWMFGCESKSAFALDDPWPMVGAVLWRRYGRRNQSAPAPERQHLIPNPVAPR